MIDWIATHQLEFGLLLGSGITFILIMALHIVYILRTTHKKNINITANSGVDLQNIKDIVTYKVSPKLIKGIEIIDLDEEENNKE